MHKQGGYDLQMFNSFGVKVFDESCKDEKMVTIPTKDLQQGTNFIVVQDANTKQSEYQRVVVVQ